MAPDERWVLSPEECRRRGVDPGHAPATQLWLDNATRHVLEDASWPMHPNPKSSRYSPIVIGTLAEVQAAFRYATTDVRALDGPLEIDFPSLADPWRSIQVFLQRVSDHRHDQVEHLCAQAFARDRFMASYIGERFVMVDTDTPRVMVRPLSWLQRLGLAWALLFRWDESLAGFGTETPS